MRIGIVKTINTKSLLLGKFQKTRVLKDDVALLLSRHDYRTERQQAIFNLAHHIFGHQRITLTRPDGRGIDDIVWAILGKDIYHHTKGFHTSYHTHLDDGGLDIVHDSLYLSRHNLCRYIKEFLNTQRILNGDRGDGRNCITTQL